MNRRLQQFLAAENISQSQFADAIGVARASVSHIIAGRNKPGFDFIENMSRTYPSLNLEWLITGKGKMYKGAAESPLQAPADDLFAGLDDPETAYEEPVRKPAPAPVERIQPTVAQAVHIERKTSVESVKAIVTQRNISKIVVFYDDNTYQELK